MQTLRAGLAAALVASALGLWGAARSAAQATIEGERLDPATYGPAWIETMAAVIARDRAAVPPPDKEGRQGQQGVWMVPSRGATGRAHSGAHYAVNKWGDTRMGIGFPQPVDVAGAYFVGQADRGAWTTGVQAVGYRAGVAVQKSPWLHELGAEPRWLAMDLRGVDRIEIVAVPVLDGAGWYGLDDLTYAPSAPDGGRPAAWTVVTFDDLSYDTRLTGSGYAGLTWETGTGEFRAEDGVHGPLAPPGAGHAGEPVPQPPPTRDAGTLPTLLASYQGVIRGDAGSMSYPPDSDGAIGPNHYVITVNRNFAVYDKATGAELANVLLGSFLPGSNGDPRVLFDQHSGRWIVLVTDFNATARIFLAVSLSDDPLGGWFKTSFVTAQGADAGKWPDYPTLGVDAHGIYTAAYMVGGTNGMSIFAIDKAPLVAATPSLGTITAFRSLPWEGAIQPAHTYGTPPGEYLVSWFNSTALRVRRINPPLTAPTLTEVGLVSVPSFSDPPNAPALGSSTPLNTVDDRLMMAVWRSGSLWTCHTINVAGRAGCRWYEINTAGPTLVQQGTVADSTLYYFFPSLMVSAAGHVAMGFTGSSASQYAGCYYTGRRATDPPGAMAPPVLYKAGTGPQNNIDGYGRNRWGDYSYTTLDPVDDVTFWTIQEYGHATNIWGTYLAVLSQGPPDCNDNGLGDPCDIDCGPPGGECDLPGCGGSSDCDANGVPDECESPADCNANDTPDFCDLIYGTSADCNANGVPDECDIRLGASLDCQPNGVPDECEVGLTDVALDFALDADPGWTTQGLWAWGRPTGGGGQYGLPDPTAGHTGPNVYGYNLAGDYENMLPERHLTSTPIDCSRMRGVRLSFWRWLGVERPTFDHASVRISANGTSWVTVWTNTGEVTDTAWQYQEFDVSAVADRQPTVYLRWTMGPTDATWQYCGWNLDDIALHGTLTAGGPGDCNVNGVPDGCDIAAGTSADCNGNGRPDDCDIASGGSADADGDGVPDECAVGDLNCDGTVDFADIDAFVLALWGAEPYQAAYPDCAWLRADANGDGTVSFDDIDAFVALLGS